jgi:hypothetical protein
MGGKTFANPYFYGCVSFSVGSFLNFISFGYASTQAVASLGGVQFVVNIFASAYLLNELVTWQHILATLILSIGVAVAVGNASTAGTAAGLCTADVMHLYDNIYYRILIISLLAAAFLCEIIYRNTDDRSPHLLRPLLFAVTSTTIGTQAVVQSKSIALILRYCLENGTYVQLYSFPMCIFGSIFAMCVTIWLKRLHWALKCFDCLLIIPLMQACWITLAILQGSVFFNEFDNSNLAYFLLGLFLILVGVYVLSTAYRSSESVTAFSQAIPQIGHSEEIANASSEAVVCLSPQKTATEETISGTFVPGPGYALSSPDHSAWYRSSNRAKKWTDESEDLSGQI